VNESPTAKAPERPGGRPRNPDLDRAILDAAVELVAEEGYDRTSIESIAHRAGVGKPTIYRRWRSKEEIIVDALARLSDEADVLTEGTVRERLSEFVERLWARASHAHTDGSTLLGQVVGEIHRSPELRDAVRSTFVARRRARLAALLREGIGSGEIDPNVDVDVAVDAILSPLLARKLVTGGTVSSAVGRTMVDLMFQGLAPRAPGGAAGAADAR
jgi:AcrR family transcriptional regulator